MLGRVQVEVQLGKYKKAVEQINRRAAAGDDPTADMNEELAANTKHLMSAVATLPQLTERKRTLDKHTNIATALLQQIKVTCKRIFCCIHPWASAGPDLMAVHRLGLQARSINDFHSLEEEILGGKVDVNVVMQNLKVGPQFPCPASVPVLPGIPQAALFFITLQLVLIDPSTLDSRRLHRGARAI